MKCFNCGSDLKNDAKFCSYCGAKINEAPSKTGKSDGETNVEKEIMVSQDADVSNKEDVSIKSSFGARIRSKICECWGKLSVFGKFSTIGILVSVILGTIAFLASRIVSGIIATVWLVAIVVALLMKKNVIKISKKWLSWVIVVLSFILVVPYINLFRIDANDFGKYAWNEVILADVLPMPTSPYGEIIDNTDSYLSLQTTKVTQKQYIEYIEQCKENGFVVETETTENGFSAFNDQGYKLVLRYASYNSELYIELSSGIKLETLVWPDVSLCQMIPVPNSSLGRISQDDDSKFVAYVGETSVEEFNSYVLACEAKGFTVDMSKTDKMFSAKNADSYRLSIEYCGNCIIKICLDEPQYNVTIDVNCVENLIFSKYDVKVYVNDSYKGTITHGGSQSYNLLLTQDDYLLKFVSAEDEEVVGKVDFHIGKDESIKYEISCTSSKIKVETIIGASNTDNEDQDFLDTPLDYADAVSFEKALNDGIKVNGKVVRFNVHKYEPDSALGVNCWSGEHLNFISEEEIEVDEGDIVVGYITAEPTKFLDSWKINYDVIYINGNKYDNLSGNHDSDETNPSITEITLSMGEDDFSGMDYQEAERIFREMGFAKFEYRTIDTESESYADTICYVEIKESFIGNSSFIEGDKFKSNSTIIFYSYKYEAPSPVFYSTNDYETAKKGNTGVFSYIDRGNNYDIYWIIDFDEGYVYYFTDGNGESFCDRLKIDSGTLNDAITITYHDGGDVWSYRLHFKYVNHPETLIMVDQNGFDYEYSTTDLDDALALRANKRIKDR